jgi:hypothetical protein
MSSARQVALILHALADADRAWLLGRLPPAQVGMLEPLLAELRELGIPADPSLAAQAHDAEMRRVTQTIRECSLPQLQSALADEPDGAIAAVLIAESWPWQDVFLAAQEPAKARLIKDLMRSNPGGAALHRALLRELAQRLAGIPVAPVSRWARFVRWLEGAATRLLQRGRA